MPHVPETMVCPGCGKKGLVRDHPESEYSWTCLICDEAYQDYRVNKEYEHLEACLRALEEAIRAIWVFRERGDHATHK